MVFTLTILTFLYIYLIILKIHIVFLKSFSIRSPPHLNCLTYKEKFWRFIVIDHNDTWFSVGVPVVFGVWLSSDWWTDYPSSWFPQPFFWRTRDRTRTPESFRDVCAFFVSDLCLSFILYRKKLLSTGMTDELMSSFVGFSIDLGSVRPFGFRRQGDFTLDFVPSPSDR